jgi:hypothetical protein
MKGCLLGIELVTEEAHYLDRTNLHPDLSIGELGVRAAVGEPSLQLLQEHLGDGGEVLIVLHGGDPCTGVE